MKEVFRWESNASFAAACGTGEDAPVSDSGDPASTLPDAPLPRVGWIGNATRWPTRIGADPQDDDELRQKKVLLVTFAIAILPVSVV